MSAEATGWVWRHSPYRGAELLVHLAIADVVNDAHDNELWMSTAALAHKARVSRSTVTAALAQMVAAGFLRVLEAGGDHRRPTRYRFSTGGSTSAISDGTSAISGPSLDRSPVTNPIKDQLTEALARSAVMQCERCGDDGWVSTAKGTGYWCDHEPAAESV